VWRNASRPGVRRRRPSLRVKLAVVTLCLLAAGAGVIVAVGASALRGELIRQAGDQLRVYAKQLTSHSFQLLGTSPGAPAATAPFDATGARRPGAANLTGAARAADAASAPRAVVVAVDGTGEFSIELRDAAGQWLLSVGPGARPGQAVPAPFAPAPARTGALRAVPGVDGSYLVIAEPVHLQARRLVFGYGADDFAVTSGARAGQAGTLVVGLRLAGIGQTVRQLTLLAAAVSAAAILIAAGLAWAAIRFCLRPVVQAAQTADAVADGDLSQRVPDRLGDDLAGSLNGMLGQLEARFTTAADAEAAARSATDQVSRRVLSVAGELRRPVSLLHALAEHWAHHDRRGAAAADRALGQVASEAARAEELLDEADGALFIDSVRAERDKTPTGPHQTREKWPST
jgi:signal transduction histidine kinase